VPPGTHSDELHFCDVAEAGGLTPSTRSEDGVVSPWQRLDPRLHLAAAIGWTVFTVVTLAALVAANLAAGEAETRVQSDSQLLLTQFANQVRQALAMDLETRRSVVQATAAQILASSDRGNEALRRHLDAVQAQFPEFAWLGVADERGRITAAAGGVLEGEDVSARAWFEQGRTGPYLGRVHQAPMLDKLLPRAADGGPQRLIDLAVPLTHAAGRNVGVLGAYLSWAWVERLQTDLLRSLDSGRRLDLLLAAEDGTVVAGPPDRLGRPLPAAADLAQGGTYLVGRQVEHRRQDGGLGWSVVVRQDAVTALAPARATGQAVFLSVLLAGLATAAAAVWATRVLTRRLSVLAAQALGVRSGALRSLAVPAGKDEVSRIGVTLADLVGHLQQEKQALQTLNAELDARVVERTARIERLAEDARHAAVTRERLRLARDLHDTLAHSLMAVLTQIRLVRKLRARWSESELEAELARAEEVAAKGLTEARAAIAQMRHSSVRETGLGPALQELLGHLRERTGMVATLLAEPAAAGLANERAETVFRIAEEALRNVERHARAQHLTLRLGAASAPDARRDDPGAAQGLRLEITDDGVGFDPGVPRPGHYGLRGIEEQAALIGARLELHSRPGQGTRIVVEFDA
jgi:signal transduction histidine kinase